MYVRTTYQNTHQLKSPQYHDFAHCLTWVKNVIPSPRGKTQTEGVREHLLWRIPGPKVTETAEGCKKLHNEEYTDVCLWNMLASMTEKKRYTIYV